MKTTKRNKAPLCACGCGESVRFGKGKWNVYINGHSQCGKPKSEEHRKRLSEAKKGKSNGRLGYKHTKETKLKMSLASKGKPKSEAHRKHIKESHQHVSQRTRIKMSLARLGKSPWNKGIPMMESRKRHLSKINKRLWKNADYAKKQFTIMQYGLGLRPTKPEKKLCRILKKLFPEEYKYVGDGKVWIDGKNPDFINVNGQKKLIEMFGDYWHGKEITGLNKRIHRKQRQKHFSRYGYKTLIVWEHELNNNKKLFVKLKKFHKQQKEMKRLK